MYQIGVAKKMKDKVKIWIMRKLDELCNNPMSLFLIELITLVNFEEKSILLGG
jgi:hypothetical protein